MEREAQLRVSINCQHVSEAILKLSSSAKPHMTTAAGVILARPTEDPHGAINNRSSEILPNK